MTKSKTTKLDSASFYKIHEPPVRLFRLVRDVEVKAFVWVPGKDPYQDCCEETLPAGTQIVMNGYSNFGTGHAMSLARKRSGWKYRWFEVDYDDMRYEPEDNV